MRERQQKCSVRALWCGLAILAGCDCTSVAPVAPDAGGASEGDASLSDSPYAPRDGAEEPETGPEPCATGIRAVTADVPPLEAPYRRGLVHVRGRGHETFIAETDYVAGGYVGRLTVAHARTGERISFSEAPLPFSSEGSLPVPMAIRAADVPEVVWTSQSSAGFFAAVARFEASGVTVSAIASPPGEWVYHVHAAAADAAGFLLIAQTDDGSGGEEWRLVHVVDGAATSSPLGLRVDTPSVGLLHSSVALADSAGTPVVYGALTISAPEGQALLAVRIDLSGAVPRVDSHELDRFPRPGANAITIDAVGDGWIVGSRIAGESPSVRFYWLDRELTEVARWDASGDGAPLGAAGEGRHALAFATYDYDTALHVAIADAPGLVRGGDRPLANSVDYGTRGPPWESGSGAISVPFLRAGVQVLTLCGAP